MKYVVICFLIIIFCTSLAHAEELKFIQEKTTKVKQASLDDYQKALFEESQKIRQENIRKKLIDFIRSSKNKEIHDFSYRYKKKSIQKRALSCEISVASDILSRHINREVSEDYLLEKIEKSAYNQLPKKVDGKLIWGNPNLWFVGNIDILEDGRKASQWSMTGYWVLEKPIAKLYESFWLQTQIISEKSHRPNFDENKHLTLLLENLEKGNSIQLWGDYCTAPQYEDTQKKNRCVTLNKDRTLSWYYKDIHGNLVAHTGLAGEHAFFLLGYTGNKYQPKKIIVWDSRTWKHSYEKKEWMRKWKMMQYKSLIIYENK